MCRDIVWGGQERQSQFKEADIPMGEIVNKQRNNMIWASKCYGKKIKPTKEEFCLEKATLIWSEWCRGVGEEF